VKCDGDFFLFTSKKFKKGVYYNPFFTIDNLDPCRTQKGPLKAEK
jgi:hypothetical protein